MSGEALHGCFRLLLGAVDKEAWSWGATGGSDGSDGVGVETLGIFMESWDKDDEVQSGNDS